MFLIGSVFADGTNGNVQPNQQNVIVNINMPNMMQGTIMVPPETNMFSLGFTSPIYGKFHNVYYGNQIYTKKITGINWLFGYTWRTYSGLGLPQKKGGAFYFEIYTVAIFVPFVGAGYDYRFEENFLLGVGFPDIIHAGISF